jgi:hypothetical protein
VSFNDMAKTHALSFRVEPEIKEGLERAAKEDRRSLSSLIEKILAEWLQEHTDNAPIHPAKPSGGGESGEPDKPAGSVAPAPKKPTERKAEPAPPISKEAQIRALREQGAR